jgi:hypothetical protein
MKNPYFKAAVREAAGRAVKVGAITLVSIAVGLPPVAWALGAVQQATYLPMCGWSEKPEQTNRPVLDAYANLLQRTQQHGACTAQRFGFGSN